MSKLMRLLALPLLVVVAALAVVGCGAGHHSSPAPPGQHFAVVQVPSQGRLAQVCSGLTDTCVTRSAADFRAAADFSGTWGGVSGCTVVDVSSYQGNVDWVAAKPHICGAIFKGGEYVKDPQADRNNAELTRLHIWRAVYWYVRDRGCDVVANDIIRAARAYGTKIVVNDLEEREAAGYSACLVPRERAAGLIPVDYTSPGTWPGGGFGIAPLWQAEYGSVLHPLWNPVVLWQCSDGVYGCVTYVPGIGADDVSVDRGILKLGAPPADPFRIFPTSPVNERSLILHYLGARKHPHKYEHYLRYVLEPQLNFAAHRIAYLATHVWGTAQHANWTANDGGSRFQFEIKAASGVAIHVG